jgi:TonB-like protein
MYTLIVLGITTIPMLAVASSNPISQRYYHDVYDKGDTRLVIGAQNSRRYFLIVNFGAAPQEVTVYLGKDFEKTSDDRSFKQGFILDPFAATKIRYLDEIAGTPKFVSAWNLGVAGNLFAEPIIREGTPPDTPANDRDAQPLVRSPPNYPEKCWKKAESFEQVHIIFDITERGEVTNISVKETTNKCFNQPTITSAKTWVYLPKLEGKKRVRRQGVEATMAFNLQDQMITQPIKKP